MNRPAIARGIGQFEAVGEEPEHSDFVLSREVMVRRDEDCDG